MGTKRNEKLTDQRRHTRFELLEYAMIYMDGSPKAVRAVIVDVSLGGMQILTRFKVKKGATGCAIIGKGHSNPIRVGVESLHCSQADSEEMFSVGFRFRPANTKERVDIVDYVHEIFQSQGESLIS
jgi:c-di-GMP-binding flagellar brake protein YcgR